MISINPTDLNEVLQRVRVWPVHARIQLVQSILGTVDEDASETESLASDRMSAEEFASMVGFSGTPPTDEECDQLIHEHRMRKYGG